MGEISGAANLYYQYVAILRMLAAATHSIRDIQADFTGEFMHQPEV
jgi:hypothetical protein